MLTKLEANWFYLETQLSNYVRANIPNLQSNVEEWLQQIQSLPVAERTLYLSPIITAISNQHFTTDEEQALKKSIHLYSSLHRNEGN